MTSPLKISSVRLTSEPGGKGGHPRSIVPLPPEQRTMHEQLITWVGRHP